MTESPSTASPAIRAVERWLPLMVVVLAAVLLLPELNQGWVPHDEGALGQAADRVRAGQMPHRDFDDTYTGGLAYLHAAFFALVGPSSTTLRIPVFLLALPWVAALYAIVRRFVPPLSAALVVVTAFVWSVPNYPAAMPSWFNLFLATFGALALLRGIETGQRHWLLLAGVAGGLSFLIKLSGVFYLLGGGIALIAAGFRPVASANGEARDRSGAALVSAILVAGAVVLAVPIVRAGVGEVVRFLVPLALVIAALIWREWTHGGAGAVARGRGLIETLGPFVIGALLPITIYALFLFANGALAQTIDGVLIKPFRRLDSGMMHPPGPSALIYAIALGLLLMIKASARVAAVVSAIAMLVFAAVIYVAGANPQVYGIGVLTAWGLPFVAAAGAAWLLIARRPGANDDRTIDAAVVVTAIACSTLLIEFPFAAPIYLLYTIPLSMVAVTAVVGAANRTPPAIQLVVVLFLLAFGVVRVMPGAVESFGSRFVATDEHARLNLERSGLRVRAADVASYEKLINFIQPLARDRRMWAGPDAPEIYFLAGAPNHTRTMFEFLDSAGRVPIVERVRDSGATLVVLKMRPDFSPPPDQATVDALMAAFPNGRSAPGFLVFWR